MTQITKAIRYIFAQEDDFSLENRLFISALTVGILTSVVGSIINLVLITSLPAVIIPSVLSLILIVIYYVVRIKKIIMPLVVPIIALALFTISVIWIFNGGINGSNIMPGFVILILGLIVYPDKLKKYVLFQFIALNIIVYLIQLYKPDMIVNYQSETERWIDSIITLVYTSCFIYLIIVFVRKQYNFEKHKAEEGEMKYRALVDNAFEGIIIIDFEGKVLFANQSLIKTFEYSTFDEIVGTNVFQFIAPESVPLAIEDLTKMAHGQEIEVAHYAGITSKGNKIWFESIGKIIEYEGVKADIISVRDITAKRKADEELTKLRNAIDRSGEAVFMTDKEGVFTFVNPGFTAIYGFTANEVIGIKTPRILKSGTLPQEDYKSFWDALLQEKEIKGEIKNKRKDGIIIDIEGSANAILDENMNIVGFLGIQRDITVRKHAEAIFRDIIELNPMSIQILNMEGYTLQTNSAHTKLFGVSPPPDYSIFNDNQLIHQGVAGLFEKMKNGEVVNFPDSYFNVHDVDPSFPDMPVWIKAVGFSLNDNNGIPERLVFMHENITERKQAEKALKESESFLKEAQLIAKLGIYTLEFATGKWESSEILDEIFGIGKVYDRSVEGWANIVHPDWQEIMNDYFANEVIGNKTDFDKEYKIVRQSDKAERWVHGIGRLKFSEDNELISMVGTIRDITESKQAEQELTKARDRAEESDRLKTAFLTNMSHEIRTPMNGILGFAELLKLPGLSGEQQQEYLRIIKKSGARMLNIINDIVDISKIEAGQVNVSVLDTKVNEQTDDIYNLFRTEAQTKGLQFSFKNGLSDEGSIIKTDGEKVYAILTNLVKNAIKYTETGSIEFGYEIVAVETLHATSLQATNQQMQFYVKDTGIGIPTNRLHAIFDRFVQADIDDKRAFQGAGLGLSISKAYVKMLGGKIWVESEEGKGSQFYFSIPFIPVTNGKVMSEQEVVPDVYMEKIKKLKILIVEDDETSEMLIRIAVRNFSDTILVASTGLKAIEICRANPDIDLVLMDIKMAEMDGYEATVKIRLFNTQVVIIAQTAFGMDGDREKALEAGCNEYISKPLDIAVFRGLIMEHFK